MVINSSRKPQTYSRNDAKYNSVSWQDDDPSKDLLVEEMNEILDEGDEKR